MCLIRKFPLFLLSSTPLPTALPVTGVCYWKQKSSRWQIRYLATSSKLQSLSGFCYIPFKSKLCHFAVDSKQEVEQHHISDVSKCTERLSAEEIDEVSASDGLDAKGAKKQKREKERKKKARILLLMVQLQNFSGFQYKSCSNLKSELRQVQENLDHLGPRIIHPG